MKFKAASSFRNTHKFKVKGREAKDLHIEKGDEFEADVQDNNVANVVAILGHCGCIIDSENQPVNAKRIDDEVAAEKKKQADLDKSAADALKK
jgi:hypothetical protein